MLQVKEKGSYSLGPGRKENQGKKELISTMEILSL